MIGRCARAAGSLDTPRLTWQVELATTLQELRNLAQIVTWLLAEICLAHNGPRDAYLMGKIVPPGHLVVFRTSGSDF